jgi:hypothetical protein
VVAPKVYGIFSEKKCVSPACHRATGSVGIDRYESLFRFRLFCCVAQKETTKKSACGSFTTTAKRGGGNLFCRKLSARLLSDQSSETGSVGLARTPTHFSVYSGVSRLCLDTDNSLPIFLLLQLAFMLPHNSLFRFFETFRCQ